MNDIRHNYRILLVGGGTGGHFYPLISIAEMLNETGEKPRLYYAGPDPYDVASLAGAQITFVSIGAGKRRKYSSIHNFFDIFKTFFGFISALLKLYIIYPDVIMSKGGYTSVPIVLAGAFLRIPIVIHESDTSMGSANKLGSKFAHDIIINYAETALEIKHSRIHRFGIPIRSALTKRPSENALLNLGIDPVRPVILVLGGSQGAERINSLILDALDELLPDFTIIHQTGMKHYELCKATAHTLIPDESLQKHYHPIPFFADTLLNGAYHTSSIVISRAGSTSIYEIALHEKPSILIPIPESISHDQRTNAYAYARTGATTVIEEENLSDNLLRTEIDRIMQNSEIYDSMTKAAKSFAQADASSKVASLLIEIAKEHKR